jgi:carboxymethylenebutenolidase
MAAMIKINNFPVYEVQPTGDCKGGLIVIHEVWGLTDHIKDIAERFGREGYFVIAPNLISDTDIEKHLTATLAQDLFNPETRNAVQPILREIISPIQTPEFAKTTAKKVQDCFDWLYARKELHHKVAVIGYCFGGSYSFTLAVQEPKLCAAVPYYGHADFSVNELRKIRCPILAFYGVNDERLMQALPTLRANMKLAHVNFTYEVYPNAGHAFFNDTNPFAYRPDVAKKAWSKTLMFLSSTM